VRQTLDNEQNKERADCQKSHRIEQVRKPKQPAREPGSKCVGKDQKQKRHFVGKVMNAIHDQAKAVGANPRSDLHDEDGGVELQRTNKGRTTM